MIKMALTNILLKTSPSHRKRRVTRKTKDTGKWCDFHKIPWHNTDECHSKKSLVVEIKEKELNPDSESDSENNWKKTDHRRRPHCYCCDHNNSTRRTNRS
jgi:hypothetical protein